MSPGIGARATAIPFPATFMIRALRPLYMLKKSILHITWRNAPSSLLAATVSRNMRLKSLNEHSHFHRRHPVDSRSAFVADNLLECPLDVLIIKDQSDQIAVSVPFLSFRALHPGRKMGIRGMHAPRIRSNPSIWFDHQGRFSLMACIWKVGDVSVLLICGASRLRPRQPGSG